MRKIFKYYASVSALIVFAVYLFTLSPSIAPIDAGELAAVQSLPGIAHPTGYPLFTMLGYIFSLLPILHNHILQMNLLASVWSALAVYVFIKDAEIVFSILRNEKVAERKSERKKKGKKKEKKEAPEPKNFRHIELAAALFGAFLLAFSRTFWQQSASVEVYSLQTFLFVGILYFLLKILEFGKKDIPLKHWLWVASALAFGFGNHMTTLLLLPSVGYVFFLSEGFSKKAWKKIGYMLLLFFALLGLIYSYLPLMASTNPLLNWGNPTDFTKFWRHFTGKQYQVWIFSSLEAAKKQAAYYIGNFPSEFGYLGGLVGLLGVYFAYKRNRRLFFLILLAFLSTVIYAVNYDIHDIDSYFLLSYISVAFFSVFAVLETAKLIAKKRIAFASLLFLVILTEIYYNYPLADKSDYYTLEDYTKEILNSVPQNSIVFTYQWDYFVSPSYFVQLVEGYRRDVTVVDKELLRRSWYYNQLQRKDPNVLKGIMPYVKGFLKAVEPFENGENFNASLLENYYRKIMTGLAESNASARDYFILPELVDNEMKRGEFVLPKGYSLVPLWFGYKLTKGNSYVASDIPVLKIRFPKHGDAYSDFVKKVISEMCINRAFYEKSFGKIDKARAWISLGLKYNPTFILPSELYKIYVRQ